MINKNYKDITFLTLDVNKLTNLVLEENFNSTQNLLPFFLKYKTENQKGKNSKKRSLKCN